MEKTFQQSIDDLKRFYNFSDVELKILEQVDRAAEELSLSEFEHHINHEVNPEIPKIAKKYNLLGIPIGKEYGGYGANMLIAVLCNERFGQLSLGFPTFYDVDVFIGALSLQRWGTEAQKEGYLKPVVRGEKVLAFALTEPDVGSDPPAMATSYEKRGDKFVLNGTKYLITNGSIADNIIVFAKSKENKRDITAFIVDTKRKGFSVEMHLGAKIGLFTSDTAMLGFADLEVPSADVLGEEGKGLHVAYSALLNGRLGIASGCIGVIEGSLNAATARSEERVQHGKLIGKHQLIQRHIAEIRENLEMAKWPTYFAAMRKSVYDKNPADRAFMDEMDLRTALAKKIASRLAFESADRAVQVFGGFGYSLLAPVGALFCDSRVTRIYEGTDEIMELKIASKLLGKDFEAFT
ncbi:MAG: acyl-CoA dehydrogenase family protein [Candidatus Micrarchaeota archaeon]|nr:acyl-CoA dehydrogenase family protein [Candidatus Micrarchaeota archaeon]